MKYEPLLFLDEEEIEAMDGEPAQHVEITYSNSPMQNVEFQFDAATSSYARYSGGEQTVELDTDAPVLVKNIFIIETPHEVIDKKGRRKVDLNSGGDAYLIQNGIVQKVQWTNVDGRLMPEKDGELLGFIPGKTWVNVVPTNPGMEQSVTFINE